MKVSSIAKRAGLPIRKIRYVLDHNLVAGLDAPRDGRGRARTFSPFQAYVVALAAHMLVAGLPKKMIADLLKDMGGATTARKRGSLWNSWRSDKRTTAVFDFDGVVAVSLTMTELRKEFLHDDED